MYYPKCPSVWRRDGGDIEFCQQTCPSSATDIGFLCRTNGHAVQDVLRHLLADRLVLPDLVLWRLRQGLDGHRLHMRAILV